MVDLSQKLSPLLKSDDQAIVQQGIELLLALQDDPDVSESLGEQCLDLLFNDDMGLIHHEIVKCAAYQVLIESKCDRIKVPTLVLTEYSADLDALGFYENFDTLFHVEKLWVNAHLLKHLKSLRTPSYLKIWGLVDNLEWLDKLSPEREFSREETFAITDQVLKELAQDEQRLERVESLLVNLSTQDNLLQFTRKILDPFTLDEGLRARLLEVGGKTCRGVTYHVEDVHFNMTFIPSGPRNSSFLIMDTAVTNALYQAVMGEHHDSFNDDPRELSPILGVDLGIAFSFCNQLSKRFGLEPACHYYYSMGFSGCKIIEDAQGFTPFSCSKWEAVASQGFPSDPRGESFTHKAWYSKNARDEVYIVAQKKPNCDHLYDLFGNVCEICVETSSDHCGSYEMGHGGDTEMTEEHWRNYRDSHCIEGLGLRILREFHC